MEEDANPVSELSEEQVNKLGRIICTEAVLTFIASRVPDDITPTNLASVLGVSSSDTDSIISVLRRWRNSQAEPSQVTLSSLREALSPLISQIPIDVFKRAVEDFSESGSCFRVAQVEEQTSADSYTAQHSGFTSNTPACETGSSQEEFLVCCSNSTHKEVCAVMGELVLARNTKSRGPELSDNEIMALKQKIDELKKLFSGLTRRVYGEFSSHSVKVEQVKIYIQTFFKPEKVNNSLFPNSLLQIIERKDMYQTFMFLSEYEIWTFLNFRFLRDLFDEFIGDDRKDMVQRFDKYGEKLIKFMHDTPLVNFLSVWDGRAGERDIPGHKALITKLLDDSDTVTIEEAAKRAHLLAGQFSLSALALKLKNGGVGSLYVMWLVPVAASRHIHAIMKDPATRPDLFATAGVLELAVERQVFQYLVSSYDRLHQLSLNLPQCFWGGIGAKEILWREKSKHVYQFDQTTGKFDWFCGAKLNVSENCLDVHVRKNPDKTALIWERDDAEEATRVSYKLLLDMTCRVANVLKKRGIGRGDVVVIYMPTMPITVAAMLACIRIGAIHCVVYSDFHQCVLLQRTKEVKAKAIITCDRRLAGGTTTNLLEKVRNIIDSAENVEAVFVANRCNSDVLTDAQPKELEQEWKSRRNVPLHFLDKEMETESPECEPTVMNAEDTLFISYTSGTQSHNTKAVYFPQAGFIVYNKLTFKFIFNPGPNDIIGCFSDIGWLGAHCGVLYGPLSNGCTTLLFNSCATYPDTNRYWKVIDKLQITHFQATPSVLKTLYEAEKYQSYPHQHKSLKYIGIAGEPLPADIQKWLYEEVGRKRCFFGDTWGQTEIGGIGIMRWECPEGMERPYFPASKSFPLYGLDLGDLRDGETSRLFLKKPLPGMGKSVVMSGLDLTLSFEDKHYNEHDGYSTGDLLEYKDKQIRVSGREDKAVILQGGWISILELGDDIKKDLRPVIQDVQIIKCSKNCDASESIAGPADNKDLFLVVQPETDSHPTSVDLKYSTKIRKLHNAGYKIWSFTLKQWDKVTRFFTTSSGKKSLSLLEKFITETVLPHLKYTPFGIHHLDEEKMLTFFKAHSFCA